MKSSSQKQFQKYRFEYRGKHMFITYPTFFECIQWPVSIPKKMESELSRDWTPLTRLEAALSKSFDYK